MPIWVFALTIMKLENITPGIFFILAIGGFKPNSAI